MAWGVTWVMGRVSARQGIDRLRQMLGYISDMQRTESLPRTIVERARELPEGGVVSPKEFLHLASRAAIDQAFSRLTKAGELLRLARGMYTAPVETRFGRRAPSSARVIEALAALSGETIAPHGAAAANALGLSQQVPISEVYLTTGPTRRLDFGRSAILIQNSPRWLLALGNQPAGAAVRALEWLGPSRAAENVAAVRRNLSRGDWDVLTSHRAPLPGWMAEAIGREASHV